MEERRVGVMMAGREVIVRLGTGMGCSTLEMLHSGMYNTSAKGE
jgi:hypothetical protein